jgi:hypothetical protein
MSRFTLSAALAFALLAAGAAAPAARAQSSPSSLDTVQVPFAVQMNPATFPNMPALQGFVVGQSGGRWLLLTGRRAGLHAISTTLTNAFPPSQANDSVYVVDPSVPQVWSAPVTGLPEPLRDALMVTNAEGYQDGDWLYVVGGYGMDTSTDSMITFRTVTAVNVPAVIGAVVADTGLSTAGFQQVNNFALNVTGGSLMKLNGSFFLVMGQRFDGLYSANPGDYDQFVQEYKQSVQVLQITPNPLTVSILDTIQQNPNDMSQPFHRRDLIGVGAFAPDGTKRLAVYGGVFVPGQLEAYQYPVYITDTATAVVDSSFFQAMSLYDCAVVPLWDQTNARMHTVLFGGISLYSYSADSATLAANIELPFIDDVSVVTVTANGTTQAAYTWEMPARIGSDARFIPDPAVSIDAETGVVLMNSLPAGTPTRVGWIYGGILSQVPITSNQTTQTSATSAVYEILVTPGSPTPAIALPTQSPYTYE